MNYFCTTILHLFGHVVSNFIFFHHLQTKKMRIAIILEHATTVITSIQLAHSDHSISNEIKKVHGCSHHLKFSLRYIVL